MTAVDTDLSTLEDFLAEQMRLTHIVVSEDNSHIDVLGDMSAKEIISVARANGLEVVALCGYRWIPVNDPDKYPACEACVEEARKRINE